MAQKVIEDPRSDPSHNKHEAFIIAAEEGHVDLIVKYLKDARVDPTACDHLALKKAYEAYLSPDFQAIPLPKRQLIHIVIELLIRDPRVKPRVLIPKRSQLIDESTAGGDLDYEWVE